MWRFFSKKPISPSRWIDPISKKSIQIIENSNNYLICGSNKTTNKKENIIFGTNISIPDKLIPSFSKINNVRLWYRTNTEFLFPEPITGWYNLNLKHATKKTPEKLFAVRNTRMCVTEPMLEEFLQINKQQFLLYKINPKDVFIPSRDVEMICRDDEENAKKSELFSLEGHFLPAEIIRVVDGDTCVVKVKIDMKQLSEITTVKQNFFAKFFKTEIYINVIIRWSGIDAQESNTEEGQLATKIVDEYFKENKNVWIHFCKHDKFRRTLGVFYADSKKQKLLNTLLMAHENLAVPYKGGKKI